MHKLNRIRNIQIDNWNYELGTDYVCSQLIMYLISNFITYSESVAFLVRNFVSMWAEFWSIKQLIYCFSKIQLFFYTKELESK